MRFAVRFQALFLPILLAACAGPERRDYTAPPAATRAEAVAAATRPVAVAYPAFGDTKPHPWDGRAPSAYAVHGVDVSRWQGEIDWPAVRASGVAFAYIKATEGGDHTDPSFPDNWQGAARAGLPRGAYHFYYFCRPAEEQARWFIQHVPRDPAALPPVLDLEWNHRSPTCIHRPDAVTVRAEAVRFLDILTALRVSAAIASALTAASGAKSRAQSRNPSGGASPSSTFNLTRNTFPEYSGSAESSRYPPVRSGYQAGPPLVRALRCGVRYPLPPGRLVVALLQARGFAAVSTSTA